MIEYIKNLFKKDPQPNTAIHPDTKRLIEKVETIKKGKFKGRTLYQYRSLLDMQHKRYNTCTRLSTEFSMRLDVDTLKKSIDSALKFANEGNFTKVIGILHILNAHTQMLISLDASYRLASCVYFWIDENLDDYDFEIGDEKIAVFKEIGFESFFLSKPMNSFITQMSLSADDLRVCSQAEKELQSLLSRQLSDPKEKSMKAT
jgi:hypothetical protein